MSHLNPKVEPAQSPAETPLAEISPSETTDELAVPTRSVRYMDDDTFQRSLDVVVTVHDRLLAKLAE